MADAVTSQILENGPRRLTMKFTSVSDGGGEAGVVKVDATASGPGGVVIQGQTLFPGVHLKVEEIDYDIKSMGLRIQWVATTNVDMEVLGGFGVKSYRSSGPLQNPKTTGATGSIAFTTLNANLNASYTVVLKMLKGLPQ